MTVKYLGYLGYLCLTWNIKIKLLKDTNVSNYSGHKVTTLRKDVKGVLLFIGLLFFFLSLVPFYLFVCLFIYILLFIY